MSGLSDAEMDLIACVATGHHPDFCDCNDEYADPDFRYCENARDQFTAVESILSARAAALRADIARDIKAQMPAHGGSMLPHSSASDCVRCGMDRAARIALGGTE